MSKTLLAVDDSVTMRKVLEITFGEDFEVVTCGSAAAASEHIARGPVAVVIDTALGNDDGYALARQVRSELPGAAIVLLASRHNPYDAAKGTDAGADDHADKPFDTQQLIDKVKKVIASREGKAASVPPPAVAAAKPAPAPAAAAPAAQAPVAQRGTLVFGDTPAPAAAAAKPAPTPAPAAAKPAPERPATAAAAATASHGDMAKKLGELGLSKEQVDAVLALSRDVVERVVWEVVPQLAETLIKEEIGRLTAD